MTVSSIGLTVDLPFAAPTTIEGDYTYATAVETGDIDGDGVLDAVAVAYGDDTLYWWQGGGDGTFTARTVATLADTPLELSDLEIVDVDGDGDADLLVCAGGSKNIVAWYENDGTPADGVWTLYPIAINFSGAAAVAAGDFDVDGNLDAVAVAQAAGDIAVALYTGGVPTYETVDAAFPSVLWVEVGDMDGDGDDDVVAASYGPSGAIAWWSRAGSGTWTEHAVASLADVTSLELADIDGDGDLDVVASTLADSPIRWYENNGSGGGWSTHSVGDAVDQAWGSTVYDIDRDGDLDIIFGEDGENAVRWWENTDSQGSLWTLRTVADGTVQAAVDFAVGDADGDGDPELFAVDVADYDLIMWENLTIHRSALYPEGQNAGEVDWVEDLQVVDVDGDGDLDLFAGDIETEELVWSENDLGDGSSWSVHVIESEVLVEALTAGDFNRDGLLDVARCTSTDISWWASDGIGGWTEHAVPATENDCRALAAADFDGDGDLDLIKGSNITAFDWYENTDGVGGTWAESDAGAGWMADADCLAVADIDGDGDIDIAGAVGDSVTWLENELADLGYFVGGHYVLDEIGASARSIAVGDIDGDGDPDLASLKSTDDVVVWFENTAGDGSTWSAAQTIDPSIDWPRAVALADLDLDGDLDVIATAEGAGSDCELVWYENSAGDGSEWTDHLISTEMTRASIVTAGDIDRDGDLDVVVDSVQGNARWWSNEGGQAAFSTTTTAPLTLDEGKLDDVLKVVVTHRGNSADSDLEPATLTIGFAGADGLPLTQGEMDALFQGIYIFEDDDDSGDFDPASDSEVASMVPPVVSDGDVVLVLPDGDSHLRVTPSAERVLFVAVALKWGAAAAPTNQFQIVNWAGKATAEDWDHDTPLLVENPVDVSSGLITATAGPPEIFSDDFESGDHLAWSTAVGG